MILRVKKPEDRDTMVVILARNGYTVRQGKYKPLGEKTFVSMVEVIEKNDRERASESSHQMEPAT